MSRRRAGRFLLWATTIAVASALLLIAVAGPLGVSGQLRWALLGCAIMVGAGTAAGTWMAWTHGRPGSGFLVAMGAGMLARLFAATAAAVWAVQHGSESVWAYLAGLVAGYVPLQIFELQWFFRGARVGGPAGDDD